MSGSGAESGTPPLGGDGTSLAGERLAAWWAGAGGESGRLRRAAPPPGAVPEAVWEDATGQLAGMLAGLARLVEALPALGDPPAPPGSAGRGEARR